MAMELFVLSDKRLNSIAEWQAAIDAEGYPLRLDDQTPIESLKGFLPAQLRDTKTGFECDHWSADELMRERSPVNFDHDWKHALAFRWGGNFNEALAAWMAAAAYAKVTNGVVFDDEEGKIRTAVDAQAVVHEIERDLPKVEAILQFMKSQIERR